MAEASSSRPAPPLGPNVHILVLWDEPGPEPGQKLHWHRGEKVQNSKQEVMKVQESNLLRLSCCFEATALQGSGKKMDRMHPSSSQGLTVCLYYSCGVTQVSARLHDNILTNSSYLPGVPVNFSRSLPLSFSHSLWDLSIRPSIHCFRTAPVRRSFLRCESEPTLRLSRGHQGQGDP